MFKRLIINIQRFFGSIAPLKIATAVIAATLLACGTSLVTAAAIIRRYAIIVINCYLSAAISIQWNLRLW